MTKNKQDSGSNFTKVDAHIIGNLEYDELPEWTDEMFASADLYSDGKLIKRGRPKLSQCAKNISIRLDPVVETYFRGMGKGWQSRINSVLKEWVEKNANA
jgi:uncharacterized protein (DUF4415 family)